MTGLRSRRPANHPDSGPKAAADRASGKVMDPMKSVNASSSTRVEPERECTSEPDSRHATKAARWDLRMVRPGTAKGRSEPFHDVSAARQSVLSADFRVVTAAGGTYNPYQIEPAATQYPSTSQSSSILFSDKAPAARHQGRAERDRRPKATGPDTVADLN